MRWHEFIFSKERKPKTLRHLAFWAAWWLYFLLWYFFIQQVFIPKNELIINKRPGYFTGHLIVGHHLLIKTFLIVLLYAIACYPLIYHLLPQLIKRKWLKAMASFILLCSALFISFHILYWNIFPFIDASFGSATSPPQMSWFWPGINMGLMNFVKAATVAVIIKCVKYWWLKQKEGQRLEKEKIDAELQLLKAQVHPNFLFKTLNNIYTHAVSSSPRTSGMLLKLSDLLSYMLYECDNPLVPLEKEIAKMKEYMQLEKIRYNDEPEMEVNVKGDLNGQMIAPFLLLPFIENSFKHNGQMTEQFWINLDIRMEGKQFSMKLTNGMSDKMDVQSLIPANGLANVQKRLTLIYPGNHELKMTSEQEMFIVLLNISLNDVSVDSLEEEKIVSAINQGERRTNTIIKYASE